MSVSGVNAGRGGSVQLNTGDTSVRQTPRTDFGTMVRNGVSTGAGAVAGATGVAAPFVPGGAVVSAAVNSAAGAVSGSGASGEYTNGVMNLPGSGPNPGSTGSTPSTGNAMQDMMNQTKEMQEMQMSFSMQYLQLQDKMQNENRQYTTISNVMKTKHDTAKSTINNVR